MSRTMSPGVFLQPIKSDGTPADKAARNGFYTLANSTTYFVEVNTQTSPVISLHLQWNTALIGAITLETTDSDVQDAPAHYNTADATWIQQNPSAAVVPITGTGASVTALTITLAGGGAGGAQINLSDLGPCRVRLRIAVTTGGTFRCAHSGKA